MGCYDIETAIAEYEAGLRGMPAIACPSDLSFEQLTNLFEILNSAFAYNGGSGSAPLLIVKAFISCVFHCWSSDVECEPNLDPKLSESRGTLEAATYGYRFIVGNAYIDGAVVGCVCIQKNLEGPCIKDPEVESQLRWGSKPADIVESGNLIWTADEQCWMEKAIARALSRQREIAVRHNLLVAIWRARHFIRCSRHSQWLDAPPAAGSIPQFVDVKEYMDDIAPAAGLDMETLYAHNGQGLEPTMSLFLNMTFQGFTM